MGRQRKKTSIKPLREAQALLGHHVQRAVFLRRVAVNAEVAPPVKNNSMEGQEGRKEGRKKKKKKRKKKRKKKKKEREGVKKKQQCAKTYRQEE